MVDKETKTLERVVGWGNPSLFGLLNGKINLFIDGTFKVTPHPFYQCLIIMAFDSSTQCYVPVCYVLMTSKTYFLYWHALHWVIVMSQHRLEPETVTCDFEKGLMKAIDQQFPRGKINGCLFHWKQAIQRKMLSLKIDQEYVGHAMT